MSLIDDVLGGLRLRSSVFCRMTLSGDWGFAKESLAGAPFHLLLSGRAWLLPGGRGDALPLGPGDVVVLTQGDAHRLVSHPDADAVPFGHVADSLGLSPWTPGTRYKAMDLRFGDGARTATLISGVFEFDNIRLNPLVRALPPVLVMRRGTGAASDTVSAITSLLDAELLSGQPGAGTVGARLADILFIQIVRDHLASARAMEPGWLRAMTDARIAPVLAAMHRTPERAWSVETLGRELGMSRSLFAQRFQAVVGQTPLEYLTHWRMYRAAERLAEGPIALPALAASVGYRSEVSFAKAFKRWAGRSPAQYRRSVAPQPQPASPPARRRSTATPCVPVRRWTIGCDSRTHPPLQSGDRVLLSSVTRGPPEESTAMTKRTIHVATSRSPTGARGTTMPRRTPGAREGGL